VRITIVGAGAIGCLVAAHLVRAGHEVELIGRPESVRAICERGLRIQGSSDATYSVEARTDLAPGRTPEAVILSVKTFDLAAAAERLGHGLAPLPLLLPQNGLGVEATAAAALSRGGWSSPDPWIVRAVNSVPATLVGPGEVREGGSGEILLADPPAAGGRSAAIALFRDLLRGAGLSVRTVPDLEREVWRKALVNAAINPVTALRGVPNGELIEGPARAEALTLLDEARGAAASAGYIFDPPSLVDDFDRVVRATASNRSSMLQDLERGRPTEIDSISGEILRVGRAHGLDLPATRAAVEAIRRRADSGPARPQPS